MTWAKSTTTKHTCGGPVFGKLTAGCPRCDELAQGAKPVVWNISSRKADDAQRSAALRAHLASERHRTECTVCTYGDW